MSSSVCTPARIAWASAWLPPLTPTPNSCECSAYRHLGQCTEASQPQPHLSEDNGPNGHGPAWLGQIDEAAIK